jgi:hypothetical protein
MAAPALGVVESMFLSKADATEADKKKLGSVSGLFAGAYTTLVILNLVWLR